MEGDSVSLRCRVAGLPKPRVVFQRDGKTVVAKGTVDSENATKVIITELVESSSSESGTVFHLHLQNLSLDSIVSFIASLSLNLLL